MRKITKPFEQWTMMQAIEDYKTHVGTDTKFKKQLLKILRRYRGEKYSQELLSTLFDEALRTGECENDKNKGAQFFNNSLFCDECFKKAQENYKVL